MATEPVNVPLIEAAVDLAFDVVDPPLTAEDLAIAAARRQRFDKMMWAASSQNREQALDAYSASIQSFERCGLLQ